jgi:hypothetical protein
MRIADIWYVSKFSIREPIMLMFDLFNWPFLFIVPLNYTYRLILYYMAYMKRDPSLYFSMVVYLLLYQNCDYWHFLLHVFLTAIRVI